MASLPYEKLIVASITILVVALLLGFGTKMAYGSVGQGVNFLERLLPFGTPRLNSFTASTALLSGGGGAGVEFKLSLGGNTGGAVLNIYMSKASDDTTEAEWKAPSPSYDPSNLVYTNRNSQDEREELNANLVTITCPGDNGCNAVVNPISNLQADWYTFAAVLEKDGKVLMQRYASVGLYDEPFVELLSKPVAGCREPVSKYCNVIECKKEFMNIEADFSGAAARDAGRIIRELTAGRCTKYNSGTRPLNFNDCGEDEYVREVDDLNKAFARLRLFKLAYDALGILTENSYSNYGDTIKSLKQSAVTDSLVCSKGGGTMRGAYADLKELGWLPLKGAPHLNRWETAIAANLDAFLKSLDPNVFG